MPIEAIYDFLCRRCLIAKRPSAIAVQVPMGERVRSVGAALGIVFALRDDRALLAVTGS